MPPGRQQVLCSKQLPLVWFVPMAIRAAWFHACYAQLRQPTLVCLSIIDTGDSLAAFLAKPSVPFSKSVSMELSGNPLRNRLQPQSAWVKSGAWMASPSSRERDLGPMQLAVRQANCLSPLGC